MAARYPGGQAACPRGARRHARRVVGCWRCSAHPRGRLAARPAGELERDLAGDPLYLIAHASDAAARHSETVMRRGSSEALEPYARHAQIEIDRLAALIIRELGESHIDRYPILDEADAFVDEVDDEHNGMLHTADAIGSLLQARLVCAEDQIDLPASELATRLSGSSRRCSLSARASLSDPTRRAVLPEHDQRFHRILNDYLERCAGDYAELLRRGYVSSPDGVDLEQIQTVASCAFTLGGPDLASKAY
jgi:hypothetical protein